MLEIFAILDFRNIEFTILESNRVEFTTLVRILANRFSNFRLIREDVGLSVGLIHLPHQKDEIIQFYLDESTLFVVAGLRFNNLSDESLQR